MPAVAAETPEKPKKPAMIEITKKIRAHFSMTWSCDAVCVSGARQVPSRVVLELPMTHRVR
jgi:hypothetical protein